MIVSNKPILNGYSSREGRESTKVQLKKARHFLSCMVMLLLAIILICLLYIYEIGHARSKKNKTKRFECF